MKTKIKWLIEQHTKDNPIYSAQIEKQLNLSGANVRNFIRELRRDKCPIANSKGGYYLAKDEKELAATIQDLRSRAVSMLTTLKALNNCFSPDYNLFTDLGEL